MDEAIILQNAREQLVSLQDSANKLIAAIARLSQQDQRHQESSNIEAQQLVLQGNLAVQRFEALSSQLLASSSDQKTIPGDLKTPHINSDGSILTTPNQTPLPRHQLDQQTLQRLWEQAQQNTTLSSQELQEQLSTATLPPLPPSSPASSLHQLMKSLQQRLDIILVDPPSIKTAKKPVESITIKFSTLLKAHITLSSTSLVPCAVLLSPLVVHNNAIRPLAFQHLANTATQVMYYYCTAGNVEERKNIHNEEMRDASPLELLLLWLACCIGVFTGGPLRTQNQTTDLSSLHSAPPCTTDPFTGFLIPCISSIPYKNVSWSELWNNAIESCPRRHPKGVTPLFHMLFDLFADEETMLPGF